MHTLLKTQERRSVSVHVNLIVLLVGLKYVQDLVDDLKQSFRASEPNEQEANNKQNLSLKMYMYINILSYFIITNYL